MAKPAPTKGEPTPTPSWREPGHPRRVLPDQLYEVVRQALEGVHPADQPLPGDRADDAVDGDRGHVLPERLLEGAHRRVGGRAEDAVDGDAVPARPEQVLQGMDGVLLVALADEWPGTDGAGGHGCSSLAHPPTCCRTPSALPYDAGHSEAVTLVTGAGPTP